MKKLGVIIMSFTVFSFFVACSSTSATHTADEDSSSSDIDNVIDESVDETHDETVDTVHDEHVDESADETVDEVVDEIEDEQADDTDVFSCGATQCAIDDVCYEDGDTDPMHLCFVCDINKAKDAWSPKTSGNVCRVSSGECDLAEKCDGVDGDCPADAFKPLDTLCGDATATDCNEADSCDGFGECRDNFVAEFIACTDDGDECNGSESCDGAGACLTVGPPVSCSDRELCVSATGACECDASRNYFDSPAGDFCSFAGINVPPTGAITCYNATADVACPTQVSGLPFFGQDAQYIDNARVFTKSGTAPEEVVVDSMTGLKWQFVSSGTSYSHDAAVTHCSGLTYNSESGWRIPNYKELASTLNYRFSVPVCDVENCPSDSSIFWAAESQSDDVTKSLSIYLYTADTRRMDKATLQKVRCVKGTPFDPSGVLVNDGDATDPVVTDSLTKLSWSKIPAGILKDFEGGLEYCESLDYAGHTDWRLPNVNELMTLFSYSVTPQPVAAIFDYFPGSWILTSTTYDYQKNYSYALYSTHGSVARRAKTDVSSVVCVR